jgi:hypothetical protein
MDLDKMTATELCAGLMRGDRVDMKRGYSAESAALTAAERKDLGEDDTHRLLAFAHGFRDGMAQAMHSGDPAVPIVRTKQIRHPADWQSGYDLGQSEDPLTLYPA